MTRYYSRETKAMKLDISTRQAMEKNLRFYDFPLTLEQLEQELTVTEKPLEFRHARSYRDIHVFLVKVRKIIENSRGTLRLCILSDGSFLLFNRQVKRRDFEFFQTPYQTEASEGALYDNTAEGIYIVLAKGYDTRMEYAGITDCRTRKEAVEWLQVYSDYITLRCQKDAIPEVDSIRRKETIALIPTSMLREQLKILKEVLKQIQEAEKKEVELQSTAFATVKRTPDSVEFNALDGHSYKIRTATPRTFDDDVIKPFIYRHRYQWGKYEQELVRGSTFYSDIIAFIDKLRDSWVELSVDNLPPVKISLKYIKNVNGLEILLTYIQDKKVANDTVSSALKEYFYEKKPLVTQEDTSTTVDERDQIREYKKKRDAVLIEEGISGTLDDLEGEFPINIGFEKQGVKWYLTIGELKIHIKGGLESIKGLRRVLQGKTQAYETRHSTEELYNRLCKLLSEEEALQVLHTAKEMGKLCKALDQK